MAHIRVFALISYFLRLVPCCDLRICVGYGAKYSAGVAGCDYIIRNIFGHHTASADYGIRANFYAEAEKQDPQVIREKWDALHPCCGCVEWARENNCELVTAKQIQIINNKRAKEKKKQGAL